MAKRQYTNGEIVVMWDSDLCSHCENCWRGLPQVFDPNARPWVNIDGAPSADIVAQVKQCPTGALALGDATKQV